MRSAKRSGSDPARLTLGELMATQPYRLRARLLPGERFPTGMRPGRRRAQGSDLDSISPYAPGDDIRWMDWRATARTGRAQMKRFVAESHLARMLIVDFRAPLLFGSGSQPMAKTGGLLAAQLAWEALLLQEPVGLVIVPDLVEVRPRRGRSHLLFLLKQLELSYRSAVLRDGSVNADDELTAAVDMASSRLRSGDEICVVSDFGDQSASLSAKVRALNAIRRFRAIIIDDPLLYRELPSGRYPYQTARDSQRSVATLAKLARNDQQAMAERLREEMRRRLVRDGWRITTVTQQGYLLPGVPR